jgi:hypothetical protein
VTKTTVLTLALAFVSSLVVLQQMELIYLHNRVSDLGITSVQCSQQIGVLTRQIEQVNLASADMPSHLMWLESSVAGNTYRLDLLINASRTGWWSSEVLALIGREYLYVNRVMQATHPEWAALAYAGPDQAK